MILEGRTHELMISQVRQANTQLAKQIFSLANDSDIMKIQPSIPGGSNPAAKRRKLHGTLETGAPLQLPQVGAFAYESDLEIPETASELPEDSDKTQSEDDTDLLHKPVKCNLAIHDRRGSATEQPTALQPLAEALAPRMGAMPTPETSAPDFGTYGGGIDGYFLNRIKRSDFQAITKKAITGNPVVRDALIEYFREISQHSHQEATRGRLLHCEEELNTIQKDLTDVLGQIDTCEDTVADMIEQLDGCVRDLKEIRLKVKSGLETVSRLIRKYSIRASLTTGLPVIAFLVMA